MANLARRFDSLQTQVGDVQASVDNLPVPPPPEPANHGPLFAPGTPVAGKPAPAPPAPAPTTPAPTAPAPTALAPTGAAASPKPGERPPPPAPSPVAAGASHADLQAVRAAVREDVRVGIEQIDDLLQRGLAALRTELQRQATAPGGERLVDVVGLVASKLSTSLDGVVASLAQSRELTARSEGLVHRLADDFVKAKTELAEAVEELRRLPSNAPTPGPVIAEEVAGTVARALRSELSVAMADLKTELRTELRTVLRQLGDEQSELTQEVAAGQAQLRRLQEDLAELADARAEQQRHDEQRLQAELAEVAAEVAVIRRRLPANLRQVTALDDGQVAAMIEAIVSALGSLVTPPAPEPRAARAPRTGGGATRRRPVSGRGPQAEVEPYPDDEPEG